MNGRFETLGVFLAFWSGFSLSRFPLLRLPLVAVDAIDVAPTPGSVVEAAVDGVAVVAVVDAAAAGIFLRRSGGWG